MKVGRNEPCPCGSGKKYKHCCHDAAQLQVANINSELNHILAMDPSMSLDELNVVAQHKIFDRNNKPVDDFCGLTPVLMSNWLYAPLSEKTSIDLATPDDLSGCPVMCYLSIMVNEAIEQGGSFKLTARENLPIKIVKKANDLLPGFAISKYETCLSISEFYGSNEDKFNALHYTKVLTDLAGIFYKRSGRLHLKKSVLKEIENGGVQVLFLPMLEAAIKDYNWGYLDGFADDVYLSVIVFFMLWRVNEHASLEQLTKEVEIAFPDIIKQVEDSDYRSEEERLAFIIEYRFIKRFLEFWGFAMMNPRQSENGIKLPRQLERLPLFDQTFCFDKSLAL